ncbi:hypothetical protein SESBI_14796 [Sesbania bispinosa]|nr:hypothetical protein SESBI_14796 [Sesbania bispinosa]
MLAEETLEGLLLEETRRRDYCRRDCSRRRYAVLLCSLQLMTERDGETLQLVEALQRWRRTAQRRRENGVAAAKGGRRERSV